MGELPNRRPHYMVKALYEEPHRGYALTLFCGCGIDPRSGRVVEVFVRPARVHDGETPDMRDAMLERQFDDIGRLLSFHLRTGVFPQALRDRMLQGCEGPGNVTFPGIHAVHNYTGIASPIGAIVLACCVAQDDWTKAASTLAREGVELHHA